MSTEAVAKADLFAVLRAVPDGYGALRLAIMEGRIDPMYPNLSPVMKRGCLKAHLATHRGCDSWDLPGAARYTIWKTGKANPISPVETYIAHVRYMEKPARNPALKTLLGWMDEWLEHQQDDEFTGEPETVVLDNEEF